MSSMRNATERRNHRERAQPAERARLGLLEKHKDYSKRAADFNAKKKKLTALKQKVAERNPDEFYFGMLSKRGQNSKNGTLAGDRGAQVLSQEASRLFKTQDLGYLRTQVNVARKQISDLEIKAAGIEARPKERIIFADDVHAQRRHAAEEEDREEEEAETGMEKGMDLKERRRRRKLRVREKEKIEIRLEMARERLEKLVEAEGALDLQRAKMSKTDTVGGTTKAGVKYKIRERKR